MISIRFLKGFLKKEFTQALRDTKMRIILFIIPVVQLVLFGIALSTDVKNIKIWVKPDAKDYVLQHIMQHCLSSQWFIPTDYPADSDPFELLKSGKVDIALVAPPGGLTRALGRGEGDLQLLIDATNVIKAQSIESYIKQITEKVVQEDIYKNAQTERPINFVVRVLFNPTLETAYFMVPGVMCLLMCIVTVVLTSTSITREKERGTFEMLISAPVSASEIIMGKTIPYVIIGICDAPFILAIAVLVFGVPMRGSLWVLMLAALSFVCSAVAIGTLISTFAKNQQQSILGTFLFLFPAILLSGLLFPLENMPEIMKWVSYMNPLSHFLSLLRNIMLKGGEFQYVAFHVGVLILMAIVFVYISYKRFHTSLQ
jgi:ABC-2 type transport system permease protein